MSKIYIHHRSRREFTKLYTASRKVEGKWVKDIVVYKNDKDEVLTRPLDEWNEKFIKKEKIWLEVSNCCIEPLLDNSDICSKCLEHSKPMRVKINPFKVVYN